MDGQTPYPQQSGGVMSMPMYSRGPDSSLRKWEMTSDDVVEEVMHALKGETLILETRPETGEQFYTWKATQPPRLTPKGTQEISIFLRLHLPKFLWNSDMSDDDISNFLYELNLALIEYFFTFKDQLEITTPEASVLVEDIVAPCNLSLRAIKDAGYRKDKNKFVEEHYIREDSGQQSGGLFGLYPMNRRKPQ